jgi:putative NADH-flavin reductase
MTLRLLVLGATGNIGKHVVDLGLTRGHDITAFVRSPEKITRRDEKLHVVRGSPLHSDELARALTGQDAVISTIGPAPRAAFRPSTLMAECAASTVAAMQSAQVTRLGIVSAALLFPEKGLHFVLFRKLIRHHLHDLEAMEAVVRATTFGWTIARPPLLLAKSEERYRSENGGLPGHGFTCSYRAVAAFLLDSIEQRTHVREVVGLTSPRA